MKMKDLNALLGEGEPEIRETVVDRGLGSLHLTKYAYDKAYAYARLAVKIARGTIECGGYLIAPKEAKDRVATDSFLARNQEVSGGLFTIEAEDVIKAGREIDEMGYKVLGWWHSHGKLRAFFSTTDDNGQRTVLNEIGAINYVSQRNEKEVGNLELTTEDGKIVMFDRRSPERKYEIEVNGDPGKISITRLKLIQEKRISFAYGLVVNVPGLWDSTFGNWSNRRYKPTKLLKKDEEYPRKPYAELATRDLCCFCRNSEERSVPVDITLFDRGEVIIDEDELMAEIEDRVHMRPKFFGLLGGRYKDNQMSKIHRGSYGDFYDYDHQAEKDDIHMKPTNPPKHDSDQLMTPNPTNFFQKKDGTPTKNPPSQRIFDGFLNEEESEEENDGK
jgi:proteasome lid subunit RPN8/RPN11